MTLAPSTNLWDSGAVSLGFPQALISLWDVGSRELARGRGVFLPADLAQAQLLGLLSELGSCQQRGHVGGGPSYV